MFNLAGGKSLLLENNLQVLFHPLRVQVFGSACLQLKGVLLEILEPDLYKDGVSCINSLDTILKRSNEFFELNFFNTFQSR